jgi:hypothetical protein
VGSAARSPAGVDSESARRIPVPPGFTHAGSEFDPALLKRAAIEREKYQKMPGAAEPEPAPPDVVREQFLESVQQDQELALQQYAAKAKEQPDLVIPKAAVDATRRAGNQGAHQA